MLKLCISPIIHSNCDNVYQKWKILTMYIIWRFPPSILHQPRNPILIKSLWRFKDKNCQEWVIRKSNQHFEKYIYWVPSVCSWPLHILSLKFSNNLWRCLATWRESKRILGMCGPVILHYALLEKEKKPMFCKISLGKIMRFMRNSEIKNSLVNWKLSYFVISNS